MLSCAHNEYMLTYMPFACCDMPLASVGVSAAEVERLLPLYEEGSTAPYVEHMELCTRACDALLPFERAIFHGVAFIWRRAGMAAHRAQRHRAKPRIISNGNANMAAR